MKHIRHHDSTQAAAQIDSSLFKVELNQIPEPSALMLVGAGLGLVIVLIRRRS